MTTDTLEDDATPEAAAPKKRARKAKAEASADAAPKATMKYKDFLDLSVERSGIKKREAKPAIEAALAVLGDALEAGKDIVVPGLGRVSVKRKKEGDKANVIIAQVRRKVGGDEAKSADDGVADAEV